MGTQVVFKDRRSKAAKSALAVALALMLALGGTFAWVSVSQIALNKANGTLNPGARLHDNFAGIGNNAEYPGESSDTFANKDIFVENYSTDTTVYARVKLYEYFRIGTVSVGNDNAKIEDPTTWTNHYLGTDTEAASAIAEYWDLDMDGTGSSSTYYVPTFNKSNVSLAADVRGASAYTDKESNGLGESSEYYTQDQLQSGGTGITVTDYEWRADSDGMSHKDAEMTPHKAANLSVDSGSSVISINDWTNQENTWVYDPEDGYIYWSSPITPGTTTGLLLNGVNLIGDLPDGDWEYMLQAVGQFVTHDEWGYSGDDLLLDTDDPSTTMSLSAYKLLNKIAGRTSYNVKVAANNNAEEVPVGTKLAFSATVEETTGFTTSISSAPVTYSVAGGTSTSTRIDDKTGILTVGADEKTGETLTVTAYVNRQPQVRATCSVRVIGENWKAALSNALTANDSYQRYGSSEASLITIGGVQYNKLAMNGSTEALVLKRTVSEKWGNGPLGTFDDDSISWASSKAEEWCNDTYYHSLVPDEFRQAVTQKEIRTQKAYDSDEFDVTSDFVFFLTQADLYDSRSTASGNAPCNGSESYYTYGSTSLVPEDIRSASSPSVWWWLRSPRWNTEFLAIANQDGTLNSNRFSNTFGGARPAFWVNLT